MNAAESLVRELQARGVPFVATLNGHGLNPFYVACRDAGMRVIDLRNEQAASYMADVAGRLSRRVGVCAVSGGVAHANALTGVLNAWFDGAPVLLITGITPLSRLGYGDFQDFNPVPMAAPICKYARLLDVPERVPQMVHEAFMAATTGRPGPVHLAMPLDLSSAEVDTSCLPHCRVQSGDVRHNAPADPWLVEQAAQKIHGAERPVLVAGSGVFYSEGEQAVKEFAAQLKMPTLVPIWDRGSIGEPIPEFMGVVGAATGGPRLLPDADLVVLAGAEFDYRVGQLSPPVIRADATVIRIHADEACLRRGLEADISLLGAPSVALIQIAEVCQRLAARENGTGTDRPDRSQSHFRRSDWLAEAQRRRDVFRQSCRAAAERLPPGTNGCDVVDAVREVLTDDTILLVDGGNIGQWFHQILADRYPGHWVTCGASGVVGFGVPGAMAARALYPDRPVILLSGDGSFTFTVAELECAARQGLPFVAVVADDQRWGISATGQERDYGAPLFSTLGPTRLDQVAEGFGCKGVRVERKDQLVPVLREALRQTIPTVIHVPIVPGSPAD